MKKKILEFLGINKLIKKVNSVIDEGAVATKDRILLAKIELAQEVCYLKNRLHGYVLLIVVGLALLQSFIFCFVALFWDTQYRIHAVVGLIIFLLLLFLIMLFKMLFSRRKTIPFAALQAELSNDLEYLKNLLQEAEDEKK